MTTRAEKLAIVQAQSTDIARALMALNDLLMDEDDRLELLITILASNAGCLLAPLVTSDQEEFKRYVKSMMKQALSTAIDMARIIE